MAATRMEVTEIVADEMAIGKRWMTVKMAAQYAHLSQELIRRAIHAGDLAAYIKPSINCSERRQYRISTEDVDAWMRSQPTAAETGGA